MFVIFFVFMSAIAKWKHSHDFMTLMMWSLAHPEHVWVNPRIGIILHIGTIFTFQAISSRFRYQSDNIVHPYHKRYDPSLLHACVRNFPNSIPLSRTSRSSDSAAARCPAPTAHTCQRTCALRRSAGRARARAATGAASTEDTDETPNAALHSPAAPATHTTHT